MTKEDADQALALAEAEMVTSAFEHAATILAYECERTAKPASLPAHMLALLTRTLTRFALTLYDDPVKARKAVLGAVDIYLPATTTQDRGLS